MFLFGLFQFFLVLRNSLCFLSKRHVNGVKEVLEVFHPPPDYIHSWSPDVGYWLPSHSAPGWVHSGLGDIMVHLGKTNLLGMFLWLQTISPIATVSDRKVWYLPLPLVSSTWIKDYQTDRQTPNTLWLQLLAPALAKFVSTRGCILVVT